MACFGIFEVCKFDNGVFMYGSSYSCRDGNEGVNSPSIIFYVVD